MAIVIANTTRGSGKTTVALNIAADAALHEHNVLAVDGDRHGALLAALANREEGNPIIAAHYAEEKILLQQVKLARFRFDDIIIDTGDITIIRAALMLADLVLIPFQYSSELEDMAVLLAEARAKRGIHIQALAFLWMADANSNDVADAASATPDGIEYLAAPVGRHKAFCDAAGRGHGVSDESYCNPKAAAEFRFLVDQITEKCMSVAPPMYRIPNYMETKTRVAKKIITLPISCALLTKLELWAHARNMDWVEAISFAVSNLE